MCPAPQGQGEGKSASQTDTLDSSGVHSKSNSGYYLTSPSTLSNGRTRANTAIKTIKQISAPANQRVKVSEWDVSFNGTSNTSAPILVDVVVQTSACGTGLG